jgi:hypothetical protein
LIETAPAIETEPRKLKQPQGLKQMKQLLQIGDNFETFDDRPRKIRGIRITPKWAWSSAYAKQVSADMSVQGKPLPSYALKPEPAQ